MKKELKERLKKWDILVIALIFIVFVPVFSLHRITDFMIFCIFVIAYDLLYGYMGRLSFGHMLYLGVGAYSAALCAKYLTGNPILVLIISLGAGAFVGLIIGLVTVRTTGSSFALLNLALNQVGYFLALMGLATWTGGEDGMSAFFSKMGGLDFSNSTVKFIFTLFFLLLIIYFMRKLINSPFGTLLKMIKENELRTKFLGYNTYLNKLIAFAISTSIAAFAGALQIINYSFVNPSFIDPQRNIEVIFACLIGGAGNVYGAVIGGITYMVISNYLPNYIQRWEMFLGLTLLFIVFKLRKGLWGYISDLLKMNKGESV